MPILTILPSKYDITYVDQQLQEQEILLLDWYNLPKTKVSSCDIMATASLMMIITLSSLWCDYKDNLLELQ